ncbi:MAG: type I 3-dehydroquinate dehydratase, partial [SAR324 cluster bacterium]|nr:type I 3-dehydroquinate dehydratase [SAR324 cluster bacterium]
MVNSFPLEGVIGIVANNATEIDFALDHKLSCVEIRADLLINNGTSVDDVVELVRETKTKGLSCLFTLRHPDHGGEFFGTEEERVLINQAVLEVGADIIDMEWGTEALVAMADKNAPIVISHHDFNAMPSIEVLEELTSEMESFYPDAIKVVPTSSTLAHSVQMLQWVGNRTRDIARIGFAMGQKGTCSRIMTTVYGAPITYASFGDAVAPGQLSM